MCKPHIVNPRRYRQHPPDAFLQIPETQPSVTAGPLPHPQAYAGTLDFPQALSKQKPMAAEMIPWKAQLLPHSSSQGSEEGGATASTPGPGKKGKETSRNCKGTHSYHIAGIQIRAWLNPHQRNFSMWMVITKSPTSGQCAELNTRSFSLNGVSLSKPSPQGSGIYVEGEDARSLVTRSFKGTPFSILLRRKLLSQTHLSTTESPDDEARCCHEDLMETALEHPSSAMESNQSMAAIVREGTVKPGETPRDPLQSSVGDPVVRKVMQMNRRESDVTQQENTDAQVEKHVKLESP
ncbi:hypothetical protein STEG23_012939 [Scotinomys teguina]